MLPKHVIRRLLPTRQRPKTTSSSPASPPTANGGTNRKYPASRPAITSYGIVTPVPEIRPPKSASDADVKPKQRKPQGVSPFYLQTGYATWAKRASRAFPPPFVSTPSSSFSDPLTTHSALRDRRPTVDGEFILGVTNGDDAVLVTESFLVVNDGVGAWAAKQRGHAALWSRLIAHFWGMEVEAWMNGQDARINNGVTGDDAAGKVQGQQLSGTRNEGLATEDGAKSGTEQPAKELDGHLDLEEATPDNTSRKTDSTLAANMSKLTLSNPDPVAFLQRAFEKTQEATKQANDIVGTTTFVSALLHHQFPKESTQNLEPLLYVTNLGDSTVFVIRPRHTEVMYRSKEQWHWFDCPRQLGTNSPDVPNVNAVMDKLDISEGDLVVAVSDGVVDNLWEHEVCEIVCDSLRNWTMHRDAKMGHHNEKDTAYHSREKQSEHPRGKHAEKGINHYNDHPVAELDGDDDYGMVFVARELVRCARVVAEDNQAESPFMERAVDEGLPFEGGKMDDISVAIGMVARRKDDG